MKILLIFIGLIVLILIFRKKKDNQSEEHFFSEQEPNEEFKQSEEYEAKLLKIENKFGTFINLNDETPAFIMKLRSQYKNKSLKSLVDLYYELLGKINDEKSNFMNKHGHLCDLYIE